MSGAALAAAWANRERDRKRIAELELVIRYAREALESNNEAEAYLILKNADVK